jgi:hypothetical protein
MQRANPNCLVKGNQLRIIDHEMTFMHKVIIAWWPPWIPGGLHVLETPGFHIFREQLRRRPIDFGPIRAAWASLSDARLAAYGAAIPAEWTAAGETVQQAVSLIRDARDKIDACITELQRTLR